MHPDTEKYNRSLADAERKICDPLAREIERGLPEAENKIWHAHPVWFLDGNPVVGYSKLPERRKGAGKVPADSRARALKGA